MDVILKLNSFKLTTYGPASAESPPEFMTWPKREWTFTLTDGLALAIRTQSRYHNVAYLSADVVKPICYGKYDFDYDGSSCLRVRSEFKHEGWCCETVYIKKM